MPARLLGFLAMTLVLKWLGVPEVSLGGRVLRLGSKAVSILALLSLEGRARRRDLGRMLWSEANDPLNSVSAARVALGKQLGSYLGGDSETLHLEGDWSCDVLAFESVAGSDLADLRRVWDSWRGDFLDGVRLTEWDAGFGEEFESWLFDKRDALQSTRRDLGTKIALGLIGQGAYQDAVPYLEVTQNTDLEPREDAAGWLMLCLGAVSRVDSAVAVFTRLERSLHDELGVEPTSASREALATVRLGAEACRQALEQRKSIQSAVVRFGTSEAPFVGREPELEKLMLEFEHLRQGKSRLVLIVGEPGAGKSRLAKELAMRGMQRQPDLVVAQGVAAPTGLPFMVWDRVLRHLRQTVAGFEQMPRLWQRMLAQLIPELEADAPAAVDASLEFERRSLFEAVRFLITKLERPCLMVLDDLQWADEASLELILHLLNQPPEHGLLLLGTVRDTETPRSSLAAFSEVIARQSMGLQLRLEGLGKHEIQTLAERFGQPSADIEQLSRSSGGNPLYLLELLHQTAPNPTKRIQGLIRARLEKLSALELQLLEALTVIGNGGTQAQLRATSGRSLEETSDALARLEQIGLLRSDEFGTHFAHDLTLEVMQAQLSVNRAETLHLRAARILKNPAPQKAFHYLVSQQSWEANDEDAAGKAFLEAGAWYALRGDLNLASLWFTRVLEQARDRQLWVQALTEHARALERYGRHAQALELLDQADVWLENSSDDVQKATTLTVRANLLALKLHQFAPAQELVTRALELLSGVGGLSAKLIQSDALNVAGTIARLNGEYDLAAQHFGQSLRIRKALREPAKVVASLNNLGIVLTHLKDPRAESTLQECVQECEKIGDSLNLALALNNLGMVYNLSKRHDQAQATFFRVLELQNQINNPWGIALAHANLGVTAFYNRDFQQAEQLYSKTLELARVHSFQEFEFETLYNLSEVQLSLGKPLKALQTLQELEARDIPSTIREDARLLHQTIQGVLNQPNPKAQGG